jgi:hypothetical protein
MPRNSGDSDSEPLRPRRPATTPEGREKQVIALAFDLVEKRIREGTATSQEVTHFLKLGSSRELLEQERLRHENELAQAKIQAMESQSRIEDLYRNAILAMNTYQGRPQVYDEVEFDA